MDLEIRMLLYVSRSNPERNESTKSSIRLILFGCGFISIFSNIIAGKIACYNAIEHLQFVFLFHATVLTSFYRTTDNFVYGLVNISLMLLMASFLNCPCNKEDSLLYYRQLNIFLLHTF